MLTSYKIAITHIHTHTQSSTQATFPRSKHATTVALKHKKKLSQSKHGHELLATAQEKKVTILIKKSHQHESPIKMCIRSFSFFFFFNFICTKFLFLCFYFEIVFRLGVNNIQTNVFLFQTNIFFCFDAQQQQKQQQKRQTTTEKKKHNRNGY